MSKKTPLFPKFRQNLCTNCGACLRACPTQFITNGPDYPRFDHSKPCTLCHACEITCPTGAIEIPFTISWV